MIIPPLCKNSKCENFDKYTKDEIIRVKSKSNKYKCTKCNKEFTWSMPRAPKGVIY